MTIVINKLPRRKAKPTTKAKRDKAKRENTRALMLGYIIGEITAFDRKCKKNEYTPTDEAWALLYWIKEQASVIAKL